MCRLRPIVSSFFRYFSRSAAFLIAAAIINRVHIRFSSSPSRVMNIEWSVMHEPTASSRYSSVYRILIISHNSDRETVDYFGGPREPVGINAKLKTKICATSWQWNNGMGIVLESVHILHQQRGGVGGSPMLTLLLF